ncbi:MAG TPA: hypothetical protein VEW48_08380 [Thermoanaerobaculia bacterium]|nr:hypothetical protein [Thermoanaerobaculia bacterium]
MIHNCVGAPVTGDDFFGREADQRRCWESLGSDHLLLLAPRRVGKTSLMLRLREGAFANEFEATYLSGADAEDEAHFVQKLFEAVAALHVWRGAWQHLLESPAGQILRRIQKVEVSEFAVELQGAEREQWPLLGERLARALDQQEGRCLLLVDEVPVFVLRLLRLDPSGERARRFLTWFRGLRQRSGRAGGLRWLLAGSIGLDTVAGRLNLGDTINDLRLFSLGPFSPEVADQLLRALAATHGLPLSEEVRRHVLDRIGWNIPYYVQLVFAELLEICPGNASAATVAHVDQAFESLLKPARKAYFDYWRQRLVEELGRPDADHALTLLNTIAAAENGASSSTLRQVLAKQVRDTGERREKLRYLLDVLEGDGYVVPTGGGDRFLFRSPLLREFWIRRVLP